MAEKEEDKKYKHLKDYEKKSREADNISTNLDLTHMEVYAAAAKDVLKVKKDNVEDIRQTDLSKLKESKHQLAMADKMADLYRDKAKEYFSKARKGAGDKWDLDEFDEALLIKAVYGTTRAQLRSEIAQHKDEFSPTNFMEIKKDMMKHIKHELKAAAGQHLKEEHIDDIIKYTGLDKYDIDPSRVSLPEAVGYLEMYVKNQGVVPPRLISERHKKPKKEEEKVLQADFTPKEQKKSA